jgi:hypothetical protein
MEHAIHIAWGITKTYLEHRNSIRLPGAYAPYIKKLYFELSKKFGKKFYMYISIIYVNSASFMKK